MKKIFFLTLITFMLGSADVFAGKRYWVGGTSNWNNTANWSTTSGGGSGASVPGTNDTAYFDTGGSCTMDANGSVKRMEISNGTLSQSTYTLTLGTGGGLFSGGTFTGGSGTITSTGAVTISGCAFTSTSGTFSTNSNFTYSSGSFTHNSGKMKFTATNTITGSVTMYQLEFAPTATSTYTIASGTVLTVNNTMTISGTVTATMNTGSIDAKGDLVVTNSGTGSGGNAILTFNGTGNQLLDGSTTTSQGRLPSVVINKSSGTLTLQDYVNVTGDWTRTAGDVDPGTSTVGMISTKTITGTDTLYNVQFSGGGTFTIASGSVLNVTNTFTNTGGNDQTFNTGTINARGDIVVNNTATGGGGNATINICGSGNQLLDGAAGSVQGRFPHVVINKTGGTLTLQDYITINGDYTRTAGDTDPGTSTVAFTGTKTITGTDTLYNVNFGSGSTYTIATGTTINVNATLIIAGAFNCIIDNGTINAKGDITVTNTATGGGGTATININGTGSQTLTGSGTAGGGRLPNINIDKSSGTLTLASIISCTGNWTYTAGTVNAGESSVAFYGNFNLDGQGTSTTMSFYRVGVSTNTRTLTGNLDVNDNFTISSGATCSAGSYTINVGGNWNSQGTWTYGTSTVVFDGNGYDAIRGASGANVQFANLVITRRTSLGSLPKNLRLLNPVLVNSSLTFNIGRIKSDSTNCLHFADNATCTVTNDDSAYVHGPVRKTGNDAFTFPLGDTTLHDSVAYHPLEITAPSAIGDRFQAQYYAVAQAYGDSIPDSLEVSNCEYWILDRQMGTSSPTAKVSWNGNCPVDNYDDARVLQWNGTIWNDLGAAAISVTDNRGMITAILPINFALNPAPIAIGKAKKTQPYAVLLKKLDGGYYQCSNGKLMFRFDEEYNDPDAKLSFRIYNDTYGTVGSSENVVAGYEPLVNYGSNFFFLNVMSCNVLPTGALTTGFYVLEVINDKNEHWYLRFKHTTTITVNCTGGGSGGQ